MQNGNLVKLMKFTVLFTICSALLCLSSLTHAEELNLKQAILKSFESSPDYLAAKNQLEINRLELKNAFASFLPSLDLEANHGLRGLNPDRLGLTSKTPITSGASLSLTESFYDNGVAAKKYKIAEIKSEIAQLAFTKIKSKLVKTVVLAYYRHNITLLELKFARKNYDELVRLSKLMSNQFYQGLKTKKDFLSIQAKAQRGQLGVLAAEKDLVVARANLLKEIGLTPQEPIQFDEKQLPKSTQKTLSSELNSEELFEARKLQLHKKIDDLEFEMSRRKYFPQIELIGTATYGSSDYINTGQKWSDNELSQWNIMLSFKLNILDWGIRARNVEIAGAQRNINQHGARLNLLSELTELEDFKYQLSQAAETYRISKELLKMEEDSFRMMERDYRGGQASYLELVTGLSNLYDAQSRGLEADYHQAELDLRWKYYKGNLSEDNAVE